MKTSQSHCGRFQGLRPEDEVAQTAQSKGWVGTLLEFDFLSMRIGISEYEEYPVSHQLMKCRP